MRRGLTTVEVLIASAIVLVFLAVGYPAARALTGGAQRSACAERMHTLGAAMALYANDHDGWLPDATSVERAYPGVAAADLSASPGLLRAMMRPYVPGEDAWFCPLDPQQRHNVLWLGQRHLLTSYAYAPAAPEWPPKMQMGHGDAPLLSDAVGIPAKDSDPRFRDDKAAVSNHPDGMVNVLGQDLSLSRHSARAWLKARG